MTQTNLTFREATLARLLNSRLRSVITPTDLTPVQITVIYLFLGFLALFFSDVYLPRSIQNPALLAQLQALKGGVEIVLTAGVILVLTTRSRWAIQNQNERLESLLAERNVLHRVFRHNLRQDMNVIHGYSDLIQSDLPDDAILENCKKIMARVDKIEQYQEKLVAIERVLEPPTTPRRMDLSTLVRDHAYLGELQDSDDVSMSLDLPENAPVIAIPYIQSAFHEVLENAVVHNNAEEPKILVTIQENSGGLIDLIVTDNGPGIPEYERVAIEGMQEEDLVHSSGLGLWIAKLACTVSGGDFEVTEQVKGGSEVVLKLPESYERILRRRIQGILS